MVLFEADLSRSLRADVTKYDMLKETFDRVVNDFGRIDGL
jgi:NAD(P)-dependent dehydrogenase (short-subunit alcohol dehydrogenase family)